ncbi:30S ribosomal protein S4 [Candidatus Pacearchaeota archaeon ex4484_31]|nr:MAG: 30S ribosomal protein S4 [Candidatus Pacearchaeota archaeon ex4484_31]
MRQHKRYKRPKKPFDKARIEEEKRLMKEYGLKNKREIWKAETNISRIRAQARKLIVEPEKQEQFLNKLRKIGLIDEKAGLNEVLSLTKRDWLERRLQTIVFKKGLAKTIKEARQLIVHRKIMINDKIVDVPSYVVKKDEEPLIKRK